MSNELRTFTVDQANALLPTLGALVREIKIKHKQALDLEAQIDIEEIISERGSESSTKTISRLMDLHKESISEFYAIVDKIHHHGCFVKDVDLGLIDFYTIMNGNVVFLCWKYGEETVAHWHEVGQGYGTRKPLDQAS